MRNRQKKGKRKEQYLKLSSKHWTSTTTPLPKFYK